MKEVHPKELEAVMRLSAAERYENFINTIADWEEAWGLYDDGWAMSETDDGKKTFPFWPAKAFAEECAAEDWETYAARAIPLQDLLHELLPQLEKDGILPGVFFTPEQGSVDVEARQLIEDLSFATEDYE